MYQVLIAEDEPAAMEHLCHVIQNKCPGFLVAGTAEDGKSALEQMEYLRPDVLITDVRMPVMDGLEATKAIRKLERPDAATIPILAMTANAFTEDVKATREAGMNSHLAKPLEMEVVLREIRKFI